MVVMEVVVHIKIVAVAAVGSGSCHRLQLATAGVIAPAARQVPTTVTVFKFVNRGK
jgi:hypothetical protein